MQFLLHTDYLLDSIQRETDLETGVWKLCREGTVKGWVLSSAIPVIYGQLKQTHDSETARQLLGRLMEPVSILPQTAEDVSRALDCSGMDLDEALASTTAADCGLDGVVTLRPQTFSNSGIPVMTPEEAVDALAQQKDAVEQVPLLNIPASYHEIINDVEREMAEVMRSGKFILGPKVEALEAKIAGYCQCPYAVGVSSGTDALIISLMAAGIGPGDEVITVPYTFFATVGSITRLEARPVFVDIDAATYNLDPEEIEQRITPKTRAIIPVHLYGQCADMDRILEIAREHNLVVIEDAAQAIGSEYRNRRAGSMGDFGCFSFFPTKNLGGFGDGGIVTASSREHYEHLKILRVHGSEPKYFHKVVGGNFRLDALQAAVVSAKFEYLERWTEKRRKNALLYDQLFGGAGLRKHIQTPREIFPRHIYNQYVIRAGDRRDELRKYLKNKGIFTEIYYPEPLHLQECFRFLGHKPGDFPVAEQAAKETLALPISHEITSGQQAYVVEAIREFFS